MCDQQSLRSACAYAQSDQSLYKWLEYSMSVKLLTEHLLEVLSLKGGCTCSSEWTLVKMPHCWKSHVTAHMVKEWVLKKFHDMKHICRKINYKILWLKMDAQKFSQYGSLSSMGESGGKKRY